MVVRTKRSAAEPEGAMVVRTKRSAAEPEGAMVVRTKRSAAEPEGAMVVVTSRASPSSWVDALVSKRSTTDRAEVDRSK
jgi:xanthine/CO dehydrogenase XdhC/CoxF family maturation factor